MPVVTSLYHNLAILWCGISYLGIAYALLFHKFLELLLVLVGNLNHNTWVLCHKHLHHVVAGKVVQVYVDTAFLVGETHFEEGCDKTAGADVVACHDPSLLYHLLNGVEGINEILRIYYRRHVVAYLAEALCECRATELLLVEREVDMIE